LVSVPKLNTGAGGVSSVGGTFSVGETSFGSAGAGSGCVAGAPKMNLGGSGGDSGFFSSGCFSVKGDSTGLIGEANVVD
jgi:hypothetical protein